MQSIQVYIGYIAGLLALFPFVFMVISMRKGNTRPNLAGWLLYTVAMTMIVASSVALEHGSQCGLRWRMFLETS
jgi:hypothetical protein